MSKRGFPAMVTAALVAMTFGAAHPAVAQHRPAGDRCVLPPLIPMPPASDFVASVDHPYFPLRPGTIWFYRGTEGPERVKDVVFVTHSTKPILGVRATVVLDKVWTNGRPSEKTFDWYAQDRRGNVWYLGEAAFDYVHGRWVKADDSWESGRRGAKPGLIMEAHPKVGDAYRQEFSRGNAEDAARVLNRNTSVSVPYGTFRHVLKTRECTPLEPGVIDHKYYARGIGEVREEQVAGGSADLELISIKQG
jgi:hypothetical protein